MKISPKELTAVMALPPPLRYEYFVKKVIDWEEAWGLYNDGWALSETDDGAQIFPLWPASAYAEACANGPWQGYAPRPIPLDDLLDELLPALGEDGVLPGVFFTPEQGSVDVSSEKLLQDLGAESENY